MHYNRAERLNFLDGFLRTVAHVQVLLASLQASDSLHQIVAEQRVAQIENFGIRASDLLLSVRRGYLNEQMGERDTTSEKNSNSLIPPRSHPLPQIRELAGLEPKPKARTKEEDGIKGTRDSISYKVPPQKARSLTFPESRAPPSPIFIRKSRLWHQARDGTNF